MNIEELRNNLIHMIDKYVPDSEERNKLSSLVSREKVPVKGIIADLTPYLSTKISQEDSKILKDIVYFYC